MYLTTTFLRQFQKVPIIFFLLHPADSNKPNTELALPPTERKYSSGNFVSPVKGSPSSSNASGGEASQMKLLIKSLKSETQIQTGA
jgi:hypothetical protein